MNKQIIIQGNNLPEVTPTTDLVGASDIKNFNELQQELRTALEEK